MRKNTFFGSVVLGIAGLALIAPMANAEGKGSIGSDKDLVGRGETLTVNATCDSPGLVSLRVESEVLEHTVLVRQKDGTFRAKAKVKKDALPGGWPVSIHCDGTDISGNLMVKGMRPLEDPGPYGDYKTTKPKPTTAKPVPANAKAPQETAQVEVKPKGAADTGEGDVAPVVNAAPVQQDSGPGAGVYALGGAGLLAAGGAGAFFLRRRSRA